MESLKYFLKKNLGVIFPYVLEWRLTDSCNLRCKYCSDYKPEYEDIDYNGILDKVIKLAPKHIWLGGGEPTLVKQLPKITEKLKKELNPHIGINTNLTKIKLITEILPYINDFIISIDTADEEVSKKYRGIKPQKIINNIKILTRLSEKNNYNLNITVISVIYRASLKGNGLEDLNDIINKINPNMCHMFCPVYPATKPDSIINDSEGKEMFFQIIERLKKKNRKIMIDFPGFSQNKKAGPINCYRRYFRIQLVTNKKFFSPCESAEPADPICNSSCNCAAFIDDVLLAKNTDMIKTSPLKGRLSKDEVKQLQIFVREYINPDLSDNIYKDLLRID